jgi:hypothetical protein
MLKRAQRSRNWAHLGRPYALAICDRHIADESVRQHVRQRHRRRKAERLAQPRKIGLDGRASKHAQSGVHIGDLTAGRELYEERQQPAHRILERRVVRADARSHADDEIEAGFEAFDQMRNLIGRIRSVGVDDRDDVVGRRRVPSLIDRP